MQQVTFFLFNIFNFIYYLIICTLLRYKYEYFNRLKYLSRFLEKNVGVTIVMIVLSISNIMIFKIF